MLDNQPESYYQGYEEYAEGVKLHENPFRPNSKDFQQWENGWRDARHDERSTHKRRIDKRTVVSVFW